MSRAVVVTAILAWVMGGHAHASASPAAYTKPKPSMVSPAAQPQLAISIGDGQTAVAAGDRLTYTITIRNLGTTNARELQISQSLPAGLTFVSSDHGGTAGTGRVSWMVSLKPGEEFTVAAVGRVGQTPDDLLRLATVACATVKGGGKPLVCATHSDLLAAGAAAARHGQPGSHRIWYGVGAVMALIGGLAAVILVRRRRPVRAGW